MSKRRNKNKKAGPVKVTHASQADAPVAADAHDETFAAETEDEIAQDFQDIEDPSAMLAQSMDGESDAIDDKPVEIESIPIDDEHAEQADDSVAADTSGKKGKKSDRKLKLNKSQKPDGNASSDEASPVSGEADAAVELAPQAPVSTPKRPREPRIAAFAKLAEYQQQSMAHVPGLPEEADVPGHWRGVGFGLGGRRLVSAFDEVVEIMGMPQITHVPGTQPWMLGVANVRGTLLPVVDLKQFLEGERTVMHAGQRVLVVRQAGGNVAVLIDQLYGQRSFNDSQKTAVADDDSRYGYFVKQMYRVGDSDWGVFSMSMLTRTPEFRQAAA